MSWSESAVALDLSPRPSRRLGNWLCGLHGLAAVAVSVYAVRQPYLWLALLPVFTSLVMSVDGSGFPRLGRHISRVLWRRSGEWLLWEGGHDPTPAILLGTSTVRPGLIVLNFRRECDGSRCTLLLGRDSEDPGVLPRLRRRLTLGSPNPPSRADV